MRFYLMPVLAGLIAGSALFFFPFAFRFIFFALLIGLIIRLVSVRRRFGYGRNWVPYDSQAYHNHQYNGYTDNSIPIDGRNQVSGDSFQVSR